MASVDPNDDSEDVTEFLKRIKELGDQREREDAERTRKLEEDILEGRKQREARRAERARSISPEKGSPSSTPQSVRSPRITGRPDLANTSSTTLASPKLSSTIGTAVERSDSFTNATMAEKQLAPQVIEPSKLDRQPEDRPQSPSKTQTNPTVTPLRSGTLSWQQRPASIRSTPNPTPQPTTPVAQTLTRTPKTSESASLSRNEIAQNLASKDPSWFRQTADRGVGSAAYRRNAQETEEKEVQGYASERKALHGMSREASPLPHNFDESPDATTASVSTDQDTLSTLKSNAESTASSAQTANTTTRSVVSSPPEQFSSPEKSDRPASPTKGMGGFVQSAMLKRSDSINKRWSAQNTPGLLRQNSDTSGRGVLGGVPASNTTPKLGKNEDEDLGRSTPLGDSLAKNADGGGFVKPSLPLHGHSSSVTGQRVYNSDRADDIATPPSPSKRWSPVKSTWLESALNKPESPTPTPTPKTTSNQPSWMVELNRNKQQRASKEKVEIAPQSSTTSTSFQPVVAKSTSSFSDSSTLAGPPIKPKPQLVSADTKSLADTETEDSKREGAAKKAALPSGSMTRSAPVAVDKATVKAKPETPPKKDFRSSLRTRQAPSEKTQQEQPEFLSAFGKLKRTQTEKYYAPDTLKNNILDGKAGLSVSSGPQKAPRKDEFKESLVERKESIKAKAADSDTPKLPSRDASTAKRSVTPEAIAKKKALGSNASSGNILSPPSKDKPVDPPFSQDETRSSAAPSNQSPPESVSRGIEPPAPTNSKLADRFNPGLASILARRPSPETPRQAPELSLPSEVPVVSSRSGPIDAEQDVASGQLQHMTKARARGPKRRLPKGPSSMQPPQLSSPDVQAGSADDTKGAEKPSSPSNTRNVTPSNRTLSSEAAQKSQLYGQGPAKPQTPPKSPGLYKKKESPSLTESNVERTPSRTSIPSPLASKTLPSPDTPVSLPTEPEPKPNTVHNPTSPKAEPVKPSIEASEAKNVSVKDVTASWTRESSSQVSAQPAKQPIKLPTQKDEDAAMIEAGLLRSDDATSKRQGIGLGLSNSINNSAQNATNSTSSASRNINSPKEIPKVTTAEKPAVDTSSSKPRSYSAETQPSDVSTFVGEFFEEKPIIPRAVDVNTNDIVNSDPSLPSKIKTLRKTISEMTNDGKFSPLPAQQEHVLYSNRMYLCTHVFGDESGARNTEVYLWAGRSVSDAELDDALLFARKAAKDNTGKLFIFKQGKETAKFFQALGGIVITRSSSSRGPASSYMLCGRQHLGQLAFDEVPYSPSSLCSGFPYIIVPDAENIFLWKGAGCNAEELAGARLISMDVGPSARVREVEEGSETPEFLAAMSADPKSLPRSAGHWKLKPQHDNYKTRLFHIDFHDKPESSQSPGASLWNMVRRQSQPDLTPRAQTQVMDVTPFCQEDLESEGIYMLDAFFEIYIIVGPNAQSKAQAFSAALVFAQEYAILAASADNRPSVPVSTVVLEGAPRDMKAVFRRWDDGLMTGSTSKSVVSTGRFLGQGSEKSDVKRGRSLRVVPLSAAIEAVRQS